MSEIQYKLKVAFLLIKFYQTTNKTKREYSHMVYGDNITHAPLFLDMFVRCLPITVELAGLSDCAL